MVSLFFYIYAIIIIGSDSMDDFSQILFETMFSTKESVERIKNRYSKEELEQMANSQEVKVARQEKNMLVLNYLMKK